MENVGEQVLFLDAHVQEQRLAMFPAARMPEMALIRGRATSEIEDEVLRCLDNLAAKGGA